MNRRAFLSALTTLAAGLAVDPERLLWTPKAMVVVPAMPSERVLYAVAYRSDEILDDWRQVVRICNVDPRFLRAAIEGDKFLLFKEGQ